MVKHAYQQQLQGSRFARAMALNRPVSTKYAVEIADRLRGRPLAWAEAFLQRILARQDYLPLKRYHKKVAHRKGRARMGQKAGRYPVKACKAFLALLRDAKANATDQGLDEDQLFVRHIFASQGFSRVSFQPKGRIAGKRRQRKSTHLEVVLQEASA